MLDGLRRRNQSRVQNGLIVDFPGDVLGLSNDAVDCRAIHSLRFSSQHFKNLFQSFHMGFVWVRCS
jgi:hypothetical protein